MALPIVQGKHTQISFLDKVPDGKDAVVYRA